jgi:hypothetical protein
MDYCKINGRNYDVAVVKIEESFNILYSENTGRTLSVGARMTLDPLGTFIGHKVTFRRNRENFAEYDRLFDLLSRPRFNGIPVEIVHNQTTLNYEAYVSQGSRSIKKIDPKSGKVYWDEFVANFIPMEAQIRP